MLKIPFFVVCAALAAGPASAAAADGPGAERQAKLIAVLQSDAPPSEKAITCKRLAIYGDSGAVPALAPLLSDEQLASWARIALEAIPGPAADDALREATGKLQGKLLIGAINSLAVRRDAKAVDLLIARLKDADAEVASAAARALGRIGGESAAKALEQSLASVPAEIRPAIAEGCILCAEHCLAAGNRDESVRLYDLIRKADVPKQKVLEATRGAILARQAAGIPLLVEQLRSADEALFAIGLRVVRELPGPEATAALEGEVSKAPPERRALLVLALADRSDAAASPVVLEAAKSGPANVRIAAIRVLARQGDASCVPMLLEATISADAELAQTAAAALAELPGKDVDADLLARLAEAQGALRTILIDLAGQRRIEAALPILWKAAEDPDAQVRVAALGALGCIVGSNDLPLLIQQAVAPRYRQDVQAIEDALCAACMRMPDREACAEKLTAALSEADVAGKCRLLGALGAMGGQKALEALAAAGKDPRPEIQDVASRLLGEWMSPDAAGALLEMAKTAVDERYKIRALRGYLRIARQLALSPEARLAMFRTAMEVAQRNEEKRLAFDILTRIPSAATLQLAVSYFGDTALRDAAADAAVKIAAKVVASEPKAVAEAMQNIIAAGIGGDPGNRARELLEQTKGDSNLH